MSQIPWWGLPLVAVVCALAGAAATHLAAARTNTLRHRRRRSRRWYDERRAAYVQLLTAFDRATYRLRAAYDAGAKPPTVLNYLDEIGPALMPVRLLASGPVRSAALAAHLQLERLHSEMNPAGVVGVEPRTHFRELLAQVPLVLQQFEAAVREELEITDRPPAAADPAALNGSRRKAVSTPEPDRS
ncbi:hypothetical protein AMIS_65680 [Actinoplanes missouriensis 431]|uniref:Secreted protein n=1 Tax=Actinoplanes missouriensis (strain ATCC 14538 / DSM 43046 / CBS 188.64 / JCM 3121 / NBRC 102363 / NCIMB 12654 / NRRL B-3342 / UNCC 431) TaxID=512565 RepID=I0HFK1_ACTM4|nr:hypothetical protein [Actinoplanes missouriensis]BAL91788.1 hypothetical protein AMIS_65680 [Actinoplanes missouriensis 431]